MGYDIRDAPAAFQHALQSIGAAKVRADVSLTETPAPSRIAPYAVAINGDIELDDGTDASGRFVLLHDPQGQATWDGTFRVIGLVKAQVESEVGADDMWADVAWSWLDEALADAPHHARSGTVTKIVSRSYGEIEEDDHRVNVELRVSWTPDSADIAPHIRAWADLMASCAGIPPVPEGVTLLHGRTG